MQSQKIIAHFANTIIGRPGNIGVRTAKVIQQHAKLGGRGACLCRKADVRDDAYTYFDMGIMGHAPRLLNAANIYINPRFDHRKWDLYLFGRHCDRHLNTLLHQGLDVAHLWDVCTDTMKALSQHGVPIVLDVPVAPFSYVLRLHNSGKGRCLNFFQRQMDEEQQAYELADLIIAPSVFVAQELKSGGVPDRKIRVIEFGTRFPDQVKAFSSDKAHLDFAFVGIINQRKGMRELLHCWRDPAFAQDKLHLCGRLTPVVSQLVKESRHSGIVTPGFIDPFAYLRQCDVFVFPSWSEGSAKAIYEAMACGLPVITTHSAGSIVRHGVDGFVIEAGDETALLEHMLWFKRHPEQIAIMGAMARAHVQQFTWERYAQKVVDIYTEVVN